MRCTSSYCPTLRRAGGLVDTRFETKETPAFPCSTGWNFGSEVGCKRAASLLCWWPHATRGGKQADRRPRACWMGGLMRRFVQQSTKTSIVVSGAQPDSSKSYDMSISAIMTFEQSSGDFHK